jgi:hypothetical protein
MLPCRKNLAITHRILACRVWVRERAYIGETRHFRAQITLDGRKTLKMRVKR